VAIVLPSQLLDQVAAAQIRRLHVRPAWFASDLGFGMADRQARFERGQYRVMHFPGLLSCPWLVLSCCVTDVSSGAHGRPSGPCLALRQGVSLR
jgi:hypothetical protein